MKLSREARIRQLIEAGRDKLNEALKLSGFLQSRPHTESLCSAIMCADCSLHLLKSHEAQPAGHHD